MTLLLDVENIERIPKANREAELKRLALEEASRPFDLSQDLKLRARLLRLDAEDHGLVLTLHHISSDGSFLGVFLKELSVHYEALATGKPASLPNLEIQYVDYVDWHQQWLQGEVFEKQLNYWKKQLDNVPPLLELPTDRPRPAMQSNRGDRCEFLLSVKLTDSIKSLARQEGVTLFMTLMAAFQTLLFRYSGQEQIVVGTSLGGRNKPEIKDLIGLFMNTVLIRGDLTGDPTFRELLTRVRQAALGAYEHPDLPFDKLVEELQPERSLSYSPLFQVMFILQNAPPPMLKTSHLTTTSFEEISTRTSKYDLYLSMIETARGLAGGLEYSTALFDQTTIARMVGHFEALLADIVEQPDKHVSEINLLPDAERQQILTTWNQTATAVEPVAIHQLFERRASRTPEALAVRFGGQSLTYQELNQRANQLANFLRTSGVGPDTLVGIYMERSLEMIVSLLAILKAGGAYVPLDPAFPLERLAFMLSDSRAPVLLTQHELADQIEVQKGTKIIRIDDDLERIGKESIENLTNRTLQENLAYVIYTSGSTGKPKGVEIEHKNVVNFLENMQQRLALTGEDILLSVTTLSFDISALEIFLPLTTGAQLVVVSRETAVDAEQLIATLVSSGATIMQATPTTWRMLIEAGWQGDKRLKLLCGGEALPLELANQIAERCASLWNMYGPTETTIWSTMHPFERGDKNVSIGRPIGNTSCYILDGHLQSVPVGVSGELFIGGAGVARGYLNRPELTEEKFILDPFFGKPGARMYRTGDLVRYSPDGDMQFLGRIDHQVKICGFRVELGEIETILSQHPTVKQAVVIVREDVPGDKRLVGYLILGDGQEEISTSALRAFAQEHLPDYMLPSAFVFLDEFPLTPNKKIDRKALPAPDQTRPELDHEYVAPRDEVEEEITRIFATVLKLERVGIYDNFFNLGGHSLLATQVISRIRQELQVELPLRSLFEAPTTIELALVVINKRAEKVDEGRLIDLLTELENLSPEETGALLDAED